LRSEDREALTASFYERGVCSKVVGKSQQIL
jgi:hypothetical protein